MEKNITKMLLTSNKINFDLIKQISETLNIQPNEINNIIYNILNTFLHGGEFMINGKNIDFYDKEQIKIGEKVEYEHVDKSSPFAKLIARKIALDHLTELGNSYYIKLIEMEEKIKLEQKKSL
jgi:hypothetical protein